MLLTFDPTKVNTCSDTKKKNQKTTKILGYYQTRLFSTPLAMHLPRIVAPLCRLLICLCLINSSCMGSGALVGAQLDTQGFYSGLLRQRAYLIKGQRLSGGIWKSLVIRFLNNLFIRCFSSFKNQEISNILKADDEFSPPILAFACAQWKLMGSFALLRVKNSYWFL